MAQHVLLERCLQTSAFLDRVPQAHESESLDDSRQGASVEGVDVLADRTGEDKLVLRYGDESCTDRLSWQGCQRKIIDSDGTGGRIEEAQEGEKKGRLPAGRR